MLYCLTVIVALAFVAGCAAPPSIPVVGAYFPDWLFCIAAGVVLTVIIRAILLRCRVERFLGPPALAYPTLAVLFSLLTWLLLFG